MCVPGLVSNLEEMQPWNPRGHLGPEYFQGIINKTETGLACFPRPETSQAAWVSIDRD